MGSPIFLSKDQLEAVATRFLEVYRDMKEGDVAVLVQKKSYDVPDVIVVDPSTRRPL